MFCCVYIYIFYTKKSLKSVHPTKKKKKVKELTRSTNCPGYADKYAGEVDSVLRLQEVRMTYKGGVGDAASRPSGMVKSQEG